MDDLSVAFRITSERSCPFYTADDFFVLSSQAVKVPLGHPSCLILIREVTNLLFNTIVPAAGNGFEELQGQSFSCGGCTGLIKFQIENDSELVREKMAELPGGNPNDSDETDGQSEKHDGIVVSGQLSEIPPSELLQFFHMHQKTGKLIFDVPNGTGRVAFREGAVIGARFLEFINKEAFFALLREHHGRFSFVNGIPEDLNEIDDIGDFMMILMEGIKMLDEEE